MLFGNENISTYTRPNLAIWMLLAFQAGVINIGGLLACQTFVSHVTGYASLASLEFESNQQGHAFALILMLMAFLMGSVGSGVLVDLRIKKNKKPKYYIVFGFLFLMTLTTAVLGFNNVFGKFGSADSTIQIYSLAMLLCFICGVQNGMVTLVSKSIVRTTHITGLVTDLGIGLVRILNRNHIKGVEAEGSANVMRVGIILSFFFGSLVGVPIFRAWQFRGFILPCLISGGLFAMAFYFQVIRSKR
ncbi:MAG: DUF1275 domain-containing protein [Bdellovibrionales bacterium CG10_big_fil_rev_8_21_14_0_10_45_34]|nr:MAG: DUF1275 domain-containing protein [Bdellovibrionales bacterium CG10_big_fil_rev_8_21_14_0_10_45_34]